METIDNLDQKTFGLQVTEEIKASLRSTSPWTFFMAILNFISIVFYFLTGITMFTLKGILPHSEIAFSGFFLLMGVCILVAAVLLFFPALFLFRFSQKIDNALKNNDTVILESALKNMKWYWKYTGIIMIINIAFSIIIIPIMFISSFSSLFSTIAI